LGAEGVGKSREKAVLATAPKGLSQRRPARGLFFAHIGGPAPRPLNRWLQHPAKHDTREITAPARKAFLSKFEAQVDPEGQLAPVERERRAQAARRAYFKRLALKSVMARQKP
jgi:hypothetical protein